MLIEPEINITGIELRGEFEPAVITPAWFALYGLLPQPIAKAAKILSVGSHASAFSTESLYFDVTVNSLIISAQHEDILHVKDLVMHVFRAFIGYPPFRRLDMLNINRDIHFQAPSRQSREKISKELAPLEPWGEWKDELGLDSKYSGVKSLTMTDNRPQRRLWGGQVNVTVEPSARIGDGWVGNGIYVNINDNHLINNSDSNYITQLMAFFDDEFDTSVQRGDAIIEHIMSLTTK